MPVAIAANKACWDDAERVASWSTHSNRPYMVVDDGWRRDRTDSYNGGPWDVGNADFPDMAALANGIRQREATAGPMVQAIACPWRRACRIGTAGGSQPRLL